MSSEMKLPYMIICVVSLVNSAVLNNVNLLHILHNFSEKFRAPKPLPIYYDSSIESKVKLMKDTSIEFGILIVFSTLTRKYLCKHYKISTNFRFDGMMRQNVSFKNQ